MKSNFSLKFKLFDIFIIAFLLISIVTSIVTTNVVFSRDLKDDYVVKIYYQGEVLEDKQIKLKDIDEELVVVLEKKEYNKLLGDVTICIDREKGICIKDVTCPNETCMKMGWVKSVGYPVTCLPNGVYVIITSPDVDKDIILGWLLWETKH